MNLNTQIYDGIVHRSAMLRLLERRLNAKMDVIIKDHESSLNAKLSVQQTGSDYLNQVNGG